MVNAIDNHLYKSYVGSYDILKCYALHKNKIENTNMSIGEKAKWLQKLIGHGVSETAGTQYYKKIMKYYEEL